MDDNLFPAAVAALAAVGVGTIVIQWLRAIVRRRDRAIRAQGYRLIHALRAYSAWIECQRDLPFTARSLDEMTSPEPLLVVRRVKRDWFPGMHPQVVRLLRTHNRMIEYLWRHSLLRLSQGSAWCPASEDPAYQQLRAVQEELVDEMIDMCRNFTGDSAREWRRTASDFSFSGFGMSKAPHA